MRKFLLQLVTTPAGKVSHSKVWSNIGFMMATFVVGWQTVHGTLTVEMMLVYLGATVTNANTSKFLANKEATNVESSKPVSPES